MCDFKWQTCRFADRFWVQALFPKSLVTDNEPRGVGRNVSTCAIHLPSAIKHMSETQERIIREHYGNTMVWAPNYARLTVKERHPTANGKFSVYV